MLLEFDSRISYLDRVYIVKDVILKLVEYGELNLTALVRFCGLNLKKHRPRIDELENRGLIDRSERAVGKRTITFYRPTEKGLKFCRTILEPYEKMFPRKAGSWYAVTKLRKALFTIVYAKKT